MNQSLHLWAAGAILVMVGLIAFFDWVPTPLNRNLAGMTVRERLPSTLIHSTIGLVLALLNLLALKWLILLGAVWYGLVLFQAVRNWWVPYFAAAYPGEITPATYAHHYRRNLTVLPRFQDHPVIPDVQHTLIHLSVLAAVLLSLASFLAA